jgi:hypothetical protein
MKDKKRVVLLTMAGLWIATPAFTQEPNRTGTTAANFLEIGFGAAGAAMGDAYVSVSDEFSTAYWNPACLAYADGTTAVFFHQPWIAGINHSFASASIDLSRLGTVALSIISVDYGEMEVTTMEMQEGTGEMFDVDDMAIGLSYGRQLATWFAFGATAKYITSKIWHSTARAVAMDLGIFIQTQFFSPSGERENGMNIGMSISNYGSRMQYDGLDLLNPIDVRPAEEGNYRDVPGQFRLEEWELPLFFRIGFSLTPVVVGPHELLLAVDALHPNNNSESVNVGCQYSLSSQSLGRIHLRAGYKSLFMKNAEYGLSAGIGITTYLLHNAALSVEYAYRDMGIFGGINSVGVGVKF